MKNKDDNRFLVRATFTAVSSGMDMNSPYPIVKDNNMIILMSSEVGTDDIPMTTFFVDVQVGKHRLSFREWKNVMNSISVCLGRNIVKWRRSLELAIEEIRNTHVFDYGADDLVIYFELFGEKGNVINICVDEKATLEISSRDGRAWYPKVSFREESVDAIAAAFVSAVIS